jgi:hypothetical protein
MNNISNSQNPHIFQLIEQSENNIDIYQNYVDFILSNSIKDFYDIIFENSPVSSITLKDIPQLSQISDASINLVDILTDSGDFGTTFDQLGFYLTKPGKKPGAYKKYGENHSKFGELLDFVLIGKKSPRKIYLTELGKLFYYLDTDSKNKILIFQILRIKIVRDIINLYSTDKSFNILDYLMNYLSESTAKRRLSTIKTIFKFLDDNNVDIVKDIIYLL